MNKVSSAYRTIIIPKFLGYNSSKIYTVQCLVIFSSMSEISEIAYKSEDKTRKKIALGSNEKPKNLPFKRSRYL